MFGYEDGCWEFGGYGKVQVYLSELTIKYCCAIEHC